MLDCTLCSVQDSHGKSCVLLLTHIGVKRPLHPSSLANHQIGACNIHLPPPPLCTSGPLLCPGLLFNPTSGPRASSIHLAARVAHSIASGHCLKTSRLWRPIFSARTHPSSDHSTCYIVAPQNPKCVIICVNSALLDLK